MLRDHYQIAHEEDLECSEDFEQNAPLVPKFLPGRPLFAETPADPGRQLQQKGSETLHSRARLQEQPREEDEQHGEVPSGRGVIVGSTESYQRGHSHGRSKYSANSACTVKLFFPV